MATVSGKYLSDIKTPLPNMLLEEKKDFSTEDIFNELALRTCRVEWILGKDITLYTTGCFIKRLNSKNVQVLTCFHDETWASAKVSIFFELWGREIIRYTPSCHITKNINLKIAKQFDLCLLDICDEDPLNLFCFSEKEDPSSYLTLGKKVFFSGFPLSQEKPLIHIGRISSKKENSSEFSIDGTIVEGHSGGPVVIVKDGKLELMGIISSQIVSMTATLLKASKADIPQVSAWNDYPGSYGDSNIRSVLKELIDNFFRNVSTGIGNANSITNLPALFELESASAQEQNSSELVSSLPTAIYKKGSYQIKDDNGKVISTVDFSITARELRKPGKGPRSILISLDGKPDSQYEYRLSNPHGSNYNKHQQEVYNDAAEKFVEKYAATKGEAPTQIDFETKHVEYEGILDSNKSSTSTPLVSTGIPTHEKRGKR